MNFPPLDTGALVVGGLSFVFLLLVGLVIRKMVRGEIHEGKKTEQLEPGDDDALAREALGQTTGDVEPDADVPDAETPVAKTADETEEATGDTKAEEPEPEVKVETEREAMGRGLQRTKKGFMAKLNQLLFSSGLDDDLVDDLEALLVTSDIGVHTTEKLLGDLRGALSRKELGNADVVRDWLKDRVKEIVQKRAAPLDLSHKPTVVMVIGVNGVGKTTTIGKLASRYVAEGRTVVLAAGDTFRAAAVEQLEIWGERSGATVVRGNDGADPASVIFEGIQKAQSLKADIVLCDTAGRLHTKVNLMEELKKLRRVMNKAKEGSPHEVMLVLDATTGQNAISQAKQFKEAVEVHSLALTKLDGTAKGGVVVAVANELEIPVRYIGVGEQAADLRDFDPEAFVEALFESD